MDKESLNAKIKRARNIMRKDAGLSTDVDRIPQLSWILFLKAFDDLEKEKTLLDPDYNEAIEAPYRWRDWAAEEEKGKTGQELLNFVNDELFPYLRNLVGTNEKDQRNVISEVFQEIYNNMRSGYLLRDILNLVNEINFTSSDDIHTMAHLYESMLKEMRDAAGNNGEFYTPRPVIRFIVNQVKPKIGEKILDPALGTGGFLTESYEFMRKQQKKAEDREILQYDTFFGIEKKPLPYLLGMMNLLLHGLEKPNIKRDNSLRKQLYDITNKDKVDVVMTNPPFGGEEEKGILSNFPSSLRTSETALLFLIHIMRRLNEGGRCGMVVPDGVLNSKGSGEIIRQELLENYNLYAIIRLPEGVFSPYTDIPVNLIFFNRDGNKKDHIWYYELPLPENRKKYTKTMPLVYEEFEECQTLIDEEKLSKNSWIVKHSDIRSNNYNLDIKNPNKTYEYESVDPDDIIKNLSEKIDTLHKSVETLSYKLINLKKVISNSKFDIKKIKSFAIKSDKKIVLQSDNTYTFLGMSSSCKGLFKKGEKDGNRIKADKAYIVQEGDFVYSRLFARNGSFAVAKKEHDGCVVSNEFPIFKIDETTILPEYLLLYFSLPSVWSYVESKCQGTTKASRYRFKVKFFLDMEVPVPDIEVQKVIIDYADELRQLTGVENEIVETQEGLILSFLAHTFKKHLTNNNDKKNQIQTTIK